MATIWDYKISFPYGATSAPYSKTNPHKGEDRSAPRGTSVTVNGVTIGTVGTTGYSTGNHLHVGKYKSGVAYPPNGKGKALGADAIVRVADTLDNSANGKHVVIRSGGYDWYYLHLDTVRVKVGQAIKAEEVFVIEEQRPVFKPSYYLTVNKDVAKAGYTIDTAVNHWKKFGIKEGRASAPNFHVKEYLANYSDLRKAYGDKGYARAILHYFNSGINEGRSGRKINPDSKITALKDKIINFVKGA